MDASRPDEDDERVVLPHQAGFVRDAVTGGTSLRQRPPSTDGYDPRELDPTRRGGDDENGLQATMYSAEAISTTFETSQRRVSLFKPMRPMSASNSGPPTSGDSETSATRARNQAVLESLRQAEEVRQRARSQTSGQTASGDPDDPNNTNVDNDDAAVSEASTTENGVNEGVLYGEYHKYNLLEPALCCLQPDSKLRRNLFFIIDHPNFERFILTLIVLNIITMILDTPVIRDQTSVSEIIFVTEIIFQTLFTLEMMIKMIALGVVAHKHSYLRSVWNVGDAGIVVFGFIAYFLSARWRTLRLVRVFRLLRAMGRIKQLHSITVALANSAGKMGDVALLMIFVTATMAVLGLQLFVGSFQRKCFFYLPDPVYDPDVRFPNGTRNVALSVLTSRTVNLPVVDPLDGSLCGPDPGAHDCSRGALCATHTNVFYNKYLNFDNFGTSIYYVLKLISMDNWPADNVLMQQSEGFFYFIYAFAVVIFGSFFCLNLVLAILSGEYEEIVKDEGGDGAAGGADEGAGPDGLVLAAVPDEDDDDDELQDLESDDGATTRAGGDGGEYAMHGGELPDSQAAGGGKHPRDASVIKMMRDGAKVFIANPWFSRFILGVTTINVLSLACDHHLIDPTFDQTLNWINLVCSIIFILEAVIKIFALLAKYFYDGFNVFDFALCVISIPEMIISSGGSSFSALRAFRLARVVRVMNNSKTMRQLLLTVVDAARNSSFLFLFLGLFLLIASIFTVNFLGESISPDDRPNFTTLGDTVLGLFIVLTGENWVDVANNSIDGSSWFTAIFFYIFYAIGNYLLLNFVIVILITSFNLAAERLRNEENAELERLRKIEEAKERQLDDAISHVAAAGSAAPSQGDTLKFIDISEDSAGKNAKPASARGQATNEEDASLTPSVSAGRYSDGGEAPFKTHHGHRAAFNGDDAAADANGDDKQDDETGGDDFVSTSHRRVSVCSRQTDAESVRLSRRQSIAQPPPDVDVLQLRHRALPLDDFFQSIKNALVPQVTDDELRAKLQGKSFKIFGPDSGFRFAVAKLVSHPVFELVVTVIILESCIALGLENPDSKKDDGVRTFLEINAYVLVGLFFIEAVLRSIAWGAWYGPGTYLSDNWNRIDFFVLLVSVVALFVPQAKALRSLRVFRLAAKINAMRTVIAAVVYALPGIANVALLVLFTFIVFGILGVQLFKGSFVSCNDETIEERAACVGFYNVTTEWYEVINGTVQQMSRTEVTQRRWEHEFFNFNHLGFAVLTLIQQMFSDGWSSVLYNAMDARSYDQAMSRDASPYNAIFFVLFIIIGNFFLINLFVGSLMDSFSHERNVSDGKIDDDGNPLLTDDQDKWIRTYRVSSATALLPYVSKAENPIRALCQWMYYADDERLSPSLKFEWFITGAIIINAILMCSTHRGQPEYWDTTLWWLNLGFAILFFLEALIKNIALMPDAYFADSWNRFDFLMVPTAFISLFLGGPGTNAIRVLRVARVLRLIKRAKGLKRLFDSLLYALPQLANVSMLLLLTLFVFGVIGTAFFAEVLIDPTDDDTPLSENFNFKNAMNSMVLLFQISTTEAWPDVMRYCMQDETKTACSDSEGNCGSYVAIPYFILFMMCANTVALNLFIFVIVDNYMEVNSMNSPEDQLLFFRLTHFRTNWSVLDREGTQRIKWDQFLMILRRIMREAPKDDSDDAANPTFTKEQVDALKAELQEEQDIMEARNNAEAKPLDPALLRPSETMIATLSQHQMNVQQSVVQFLMAKRESSFMRMVFRMDVPLDDSGYVRYSDCVYAITKEHHGLDREAEVQAAKFLGLSRDSDPSTFYDCFKVHHALAVRKILRILRMRRREAKLQKRMRNFFTADGDDDIEEITSTASMSQSDVGNEPAATHDPLSPSRSPSRRSAADATSRPASSSGTAPPGAVDSQRSTPSPES